MSSRISYEGDNKGHEVEINPGDLPRVTVVLATQQFMDSEPVMRAIYSIEHQDYPADKVDLHLVFETFVEDEPVNGLPALRRFGVEAADTDWIVFADDETDWDPDYLAGLVWRLVNMHGVATWRKLSDEVPLITLKSVWLEGLK